MSLSDKEYAEAVIQKFEANSRDLTAQLERNQFYIDQWKEVANGTRSVKGVELHKFDKKRFRS